MRRIAVAVALIIGVLLVGAAPAAAHTSLVGSDPSADSVLDSAPTSIRLTFSEAISASFATITLVGPDGQQYAQPDTAVQGATASAGVLDGLPAGSYTIGYRVLSADGHPVSGTTLFTLTTAAPPPSDLAVSNRADAPAPAVEAQNDSGGINPIVIWGLLGVLIVAAGIKAFGVRGRDR